jgi:hypothetical protein
MANKCYYGLKNQLQSHYLSRDTKCKLYKTLIRPVITYGSDSWTLNKGNTDKLNSNNILVKEQFGFRKDLTTEKATYELINDILSALNDRLKAQYTTVDYN